MVNYFLVVDELFLLILDKVCLQILNVLLHLDDWITSLFKQEPLHLLIFSLFLIIWLRVAQFLVEYGALCFLVLSIYLLVNFECTQTHIVP